MREDDPSTIYQLTPLVNFQAALDQMNVDHLTVNPDRVLVIFRKAVLNIEVVDGNLEIATRVAVEVLDLPHSSEDAANDLLEKQFLEHLGTTTEADWVETPRNT